MVDAKKKCPEGQTLDRQTKECRDKKKSGPKKKAAEPEPVKLTKELLDKKSYAEVVGIHKTMENQGKIMMRKGMKRDREHLVERILRKQ